MVTTAAEFPCLLYEYDSQGRYGKPVKVDNEDALRDAFLTTIRKALDEKREIRITDMLDMLMFHAKDGRILWGGGGTPP